MTTHPETPVAQIKPHFEISKGMLEDFARGAAILGTGGGGDPYLGRLMAEAAIEEFGPPAVLNVHDLADDALVVFVAMLGAPTVLVEKALSGDDLDEAIRLMEQRLGRPIDALMPVEIGGMNSTVPIIAAARLGKPLVNADGMGRAFPEIQMVTMNFSGVSATPFVVVDEHLNSIMVESRSAVTTEAFVRSAAIQMGLSCIVAGYPMNGAELKTSTVHGTLTAALEIGRAIADGRAAGHPIESLLTAMRSIEIYGYARLLFGGKIIDVQRETTGGFSIGNCKIAGLYAANQVMEIRFQNENLVATVDGQVCAVVPDLITIIDSATAEPIPTEAFRYGQRVSVIAAAAPEPLTTEEALAFVHPRCFGLDMDFTPIQELPSTPVPIAEIE